jgi:hypothetical protein
MPVSVHSSLQPAARSRSKSVRFGLEAEPPFICTRCSLRYAAVSGQAGGGGHPEGAIRVGHAIGCRV